MVLQYLHYYKVIQNLYYQNSNELIFEKVGEQLSPQIDISSPNVWLFIGGIILIVGIAFVVSLFFRNYSIHSIVPGRSHPQLRIRPEMHRKAKTR